jgi:hypothetical protein
MRFVLIFAASLVGLFASRRKPTMRRASIRFWDTGADSIRLADGECAHDIDYVSLTRNGNFFSLSGTALRSVLATTAALRGPCRSATSR